MAVSASALHRPAAKVEAYQPGLCNIGPQEIARRRRIGHLGLAASLALLLLLIAADAPPVSRLVLALPATMAAAGYLQARLRFCVAFGMRGVSNLGPLGRADEVADARARARDRQRAMRLGLASVAIGLAVGSMAGVVAAVVDGMR